MRTTEDLTGQEFGKWKVIERDTESRCNAYWVCRCECGIVKAVSGSHLRLGKTTSCRKCSEQKHKGRLSSRIWHRIKYRAKKKGLIVDFGKDSEARVFLYDLLYNQQKGLCVLSGMPIDIANTIRGDQVGETTASLDRRDSSKGYTKDNVQWVHKWINLMKSDFAETEFISYCEAVVKHKEKLCH